MIIQMFCFIRLYILFAYSLKKLSLKNSSLSLSFFNKIPSVTSLLSLIIEKDADIGLDFNLFQYRFKTKT